MYKHQPLAKPMMITATDGTIVEVLGPYVGTANDASIINNDLSRGPAADQEIDSGSDEEVDFPKCKKRRLNDHQRVPDNASSETDNDQNTPEDANSAPDNHQRESDNASSAIDDHQRAHNITSSQTNNHQRVPEDANSATGDRQRASDNATYHTDDHQRVRPNKGCSMKGHSKRARPNKKNFQKRANTASSKKGVRHVNSRKHVFTDKEPTRGLEHRSFISVTEEASTSEESQEDNTGRQEGIGSQEPSNEEDDSSSESDNPSTSTGSKKSKKRRRESREQKEKEYTKEEDEEFRRLVKDILKRAMKDDASQILAWMELLDVLVLDRGFRDCLEMLKVKYIKFYCWGRGI